MGDAVLAPVLVSTEVVRQGGKQYLVALMPSKSSPGKFYRTDVTNGRCDCPGWKFAKIDPDTGFRPACTHLKQLGWSQIVDPKAAVEKTPKPKKEGKTFPTLTPEQLEKL